LNHVLVNKNIQIEVSELGAELKSIQVQGEEKLWPGKRLWQRSSPILFPVVGKCAKDQIIVKGKSYPMGQHGFARDRRFEVLTKTEDKLSFRLSSDAETKKHFPFDFELILHYQLDDDSVHIGYKVKNSGTGNMFFSIGAHPAFLLDAHAKQTQLRFNKKEDQNRHLLHDGLFNGKKEASLKSGVLDLSNEDFKTDAIVYKGLSSTEVELIQDGQKKLSMLFSGFPYFGVWSKPDCQEFLCLEPWIGCADPIGFEEELEQKQGILELASGRTFNAKWSVSFEA